MGQQRTAAESRIVELLNAPAEQIVPGQLPPRPAAMLQDPLSTNPELGKLTKLLMNLAPEMRKKVNFVSGGPTKGAFGVVETVNKLLPKEEPTDPANMFDNGILGHFDRKRKEVFISPVTTKSWMRSTDRTAPTLGHEFSHAAGHQHESGVPAEMEKLMLQLLDARRKK